MFSCKFCGKEVKSKTGLTQHQNLFCKNNPNKRDNNSAHSEETKRKIGQSLLRKKPNTLSEVSKRTVSKIIKRLEIGCSICGWDECNGDIHHIKPQSEGGGDEHSNLTYLCPNCHRKAHNGLIDKFISFDEQVGERWRDCYYSHAKIECLTKEKKNSGKKRVLKSNTLIDGKCEEIKQSKIDFSKYGWVQKVSVILEIEPQKVNQWMKKNMKHFYEEKCFRRKRIATGTGD